MDDFDNAQVLPDGQVIVRGEGNRFAPGGKLPSAVASERGKKGAEVRNQMTDETAQEQAEAVALELGFAGLADAPPSIRMMLTRAAKKDDLGALQKAMMQAGKWIGARQQEAPAAERVPVLMLSPEAAAEIARIFESRANRLGVVLADMMFEPAHAATAREAMKRAGWPMPVEAL